MTPKEIQEELSLRDDLIKRTFDTSFLVEAGAGAGKSYTMTNRIVNLLLDRPDLCAPEQLVAITFTVKATQELRGKLEKEFRSRLEKAEQTLAAAPDEETRKKVETLRDLARRVDRIQVSTIDSFCRKLLTIMPFSNPLGLSGVLEADEEKLARSFFARYARRNVADFLALEARYAIKESSLENAFVACCGNGDFVPVVPAPDDQDMVDVRNTKLPEAGKALWKAMKELPNQHPELKGLYHPTLEALLERKDEDFEPDGAGLEEFLTFFRSHQSAVGSEYNAVVMSDKWNAFYAPYGEFMGTIFGGKGASGPITTDLLKKLVKKDADVPLCQQTLDDLAAALVTPPVNPNRDKWIDKELVDLVTDLQGKTFAVDAQGIENATLQKFRAYFRKHTSLKSLKKYDLPSNSAEKWVSALWTPKNDDTSYSALVSRTLHWEAMNLLLPAVEAYREEKRQLSTATFNDVLVMARNMLREPTNTAVRDFFRKRYRCFYVDEFQDTDAVQTELLFYLASDEDGFCSGNWEACTPRPGSLFLVGDPKQGIYRFRGADVNTYHRVRALFGKGGIGKLEVLHFNFRSTMEICDFSRLTFQPGKDDDEKKRKEDYPVLEASPYQAAYADMTAMPSGGTAPRTADANSRICSYDANKKDDPQAVAVLIQAMIENKVPLAARKGDPAPTAKAEDFLILTAKKKEANLYADALRRRGIPVLLSGEARYDATAPIAACMRYLRCMAEPSDPLALLDVLRRCYGARYQDIRQLLLRAGLKKPQQLFRRVTPAEPTLHLDAVSAALDPGDPADAPLCALCDALREIRSFQTLARTAPAMSVLERLFETVGCLWPETGSLLDRRADYARVQQFLHTLRAERERDFPSLARRALELAETEVEDELPLEPKSPCVRIMNLHKAKGLEGEIVILAAHGNRSTEPSSYRETVGGAQKLHLCITEQTSKQYNIFRVIAREKDWAVSGKKEEAYAKAERDRLLYVAVTRAKSMLIVNDCGYWKPVSRVIKDVEYEKQEQAALTWSTYWKQQKDAGVLLPKEMQPKMPTDAELRMEAAMCSIPLARIVSWEKVKEAHQAEIDAWEKKREALQNPPAQSPDADPQPTAQQPVPQPDAQQSGSQPDNTAQPGPAPSFAPVDFAAHAAAQRDAVQKLAESAFYTVTPSGLDKLARKQPLRVRSDAEDVEAGQEDAPAPDPAGLPTGDPDYDDDLAALSAAYPQDGDDEDDTGETDAPASGNVPRGKHWGTIVHRIMELAVKNRQYDAQRIRAFARQAAHETLADTPLTPTERSYLCCGDAEGEALLKLVAEAAEKAAAFLSDETSALRRLTEGKQCFPELQFFVRAEDRDSPLYQHLSANLRTEAAKDRTLDVNGIIDLAVRAADGSWTVVDYKTDALWIGETAEHLADRLTRHYWAQIAAYAKVLELQQGARVTRAYLCSVSMGGRLIELQLDEAPAARGKQKKKPAAPAAVPAAPASAQSAPAAPAAAAPAAKASAAANRPAASLKRGRSFAKELQNAENATGFSLVFQGQRMMLTDKHGKARDSFKMCRDFAGAVARWAKERHPEADCSVDFTNAGSERVLRRLLKMLHAALTQAEWEALELRWEPRK